MRPHVIGCAWILACAAAAAGEVNVPGPAGSSPMATRSAPAAVKAGTVSAPAEPIDINSASRAQLKQLSGIGDAEVDRIIAGRPYLSKVHLVTEAGLPMGLYLTIRRQIVAVQNGEARAKLKTLAAAQQPQSR